MNKLKIFNNPKHMEYTIETNDRPFKAIQAGTKTVEGRTPTKLDKTPYDLMKSGDLLTIVNNHSHETFKADVIFVHHYSSVKQMLEVEGPDKVLSSNPKTIKHGIDSYNSIEGYKEGIKDNGIYAIGLKVHYSEINKKMYQ